VTRAAGGPIFADYERSVRRFIEGTAVEGLGYDPCMCGIPHGLRTLAPDAVEIFVETTPPGAECVISQSGQTIGRIAPTPGIVLVPNIEADYYVSCSRNGYQPVSLMVQPGR